MEMKGHESVERNLNELPTRERILLATIQVIEKEGVHSLTTRGIAKAAEVNSAAINYYFGTKERLIEETLKYSLSHLFEDLGVMYGKDRTDKHSLLKDILTYYLEGALKYPGLIKAHFYEPLIHNRYDTPSIRLLLENLQGIIDHIAVLEPGVEKETLKMQVLQKLSAVLMPAMLPEFFENFLGEDFAQDFEKQQKYIKTLFE